MMRISSIIPKGNQAHGALFNENVRFSANEKSESTVKRAGKKDDKQNPVIQVKNQSLEEAITNLKEQIEKVKTNDKLDDKAKKRKIDALKEQISDLEEMERRRKTEEAAKILEGSKDKDEEKAQKNKNDSESGFEDKEGVQVSFSAEGFKNLVTANLELRKAGENKLNKSKKSLELVQSEIELEKDKDYGQSMQNSIKAADSAMVAKKITDKAIKDFTDEYGTVDDLLKEVDMKDKAAVKEYLSVYSKAMTNFVKQRVDEVLNSKEFKSSYIYDNNKKESLINDLQGIIGSIDNLIMLNLEKANEAAEGANTNEPERTEKEALHSDDDSVNTIISEGVRGEIDKRLGSEA